MITLLYGVLSKNVSVLAEQNMAEKLKTGALNTVLGMGTVFIILILIIILLNFFKLIPYLQNKMANKEEDTSHSVDQVLAQIVEQEEEELSDDHELVAVITAAIYAAMGDAVPVDGLVVRSIRKINTRKR
ncbi:MAG: hypothetical protein K0S76_3022, partial [Herbinix sp.]|nr:hypothetical protein [Herbinix sp.]